MDDVSEPTRMTAHNVLKNDISRAESRVESLRNLEKLIDWDNLTASEDAGLWSLFTTHGAI